MAVSWLAIALAFGLLLLVTKNRLDSQTRHICSHLVVVQQNQRAVLHALRSLRLSILADPTSTPYQRDYARRSLKQLAAVQQRVELVTCGGNHK